MASARKRGRPSLAAVQVEMYRQKGTAIGIKNAIRFFLGIDITAITPLQKSRRFAIETA